MQETEYLTVTQVAAILNISTDSVIRRFGDQPGVIDLGTPDRLHKRRYRVLRVPRRTNTLEWGAPLRTTLSVLIARSFTAA